MIITKLYLLDQLLMIIVSTLLVYYSLISNSIAQISVHMSVGSGNYTIIIIN